MDCPCEFAACTHGTAEVSGNTHCTSICELVLHTCCSDHWVKLHLKRVPVRGCQLLTQTFPYMCLFEFYIFWCLVLLWGCPFGCGIVTRLRQYFSDMVNLIVIWRTETVQSHCVMDRFPFPSTFISLSHIVVDCFFCIVWHHHVMPVYNFLLLYLKR